LKSFARLREFAALAPKALTLAVADVDKWGAQLGMPPRAGADPGQRERAKTMHERLKNQIPEIAADLQKMLDKIDKHTAGVAEETRKQAWEALTDDTQKLLGQFDTIITMQTQARVFLIELPEVEQRQAEAFALARENRLDLQNRLALVTDAWRQVRIAANALMSDLNVIAQAEIGTDKDHDRPFNFAAEASRYAVGLRFDGPLNRLAERNAYRASLIAYQRAKRAYLELLDQVEQQVRQDFRQLNRLRISFEISQLQLLSAARQFENARLTLLGPREKRTANDSTTLNLLNALNSLLGARNQLVSNYINFEQQRVQLLLDLEVLHLDPRGFPVHADPRPPVPTDLPPAKPGNDAEPHDGD
jgi:Outer membrane efflux protein